MAIVSKPPATLHIISKKLNLSPSNTSLQEAIIKQRYIDNIGSCIIPKINAVIIAP